MDLKPCTALIGSILVPDIANPRPIDVDVAFMRYRMCTIVRFTGHPAALTLDEHQRLAALLAEVSDMGAAVVEWAHHHDHHEYATGDLIRPLQRAIGAVRLHEMQARWDEAICAALDIRLPSIEVRDQVSLVDELAMGMEWRHCLGRDLSEIGLSGEMAEVCQHEGMLWEVLTAERRHQVLAARTVMTG